MKNQNSFGSNLNELQDHLDSLSWLTDKIELPFSVILDKNLDTNSVTSWTRILRIDGTVMHKRMDPNGFVDEEPDAAVVALVVEVFELVLHLSNFPIFGSEPRIRSSSLDQDKRAVHAAVNFSAVDRTPVSVYERSLNRAVNFVDWLAKNTPTPENVPIAFKILDPRNFLHGLGALAGGKSNIPVLRVAYNLGMPILHLGMGIYQIGMGSKARKLDRSLTSLDSHIGVRLVSDKAISAEVLNQAGFPAPEHRIVATEQQAIAAAREIGFPVVVKPRDLDRGEGVKVDIHSPQDVADAFRNALQSSKTNTVLIERQVPGVCHRIFVANGRVLYAVKRKPIFVVADGFSTVRDLILALIDSQKSLPPWQRLPLQEIDGLTLESLRNNGISLDDVLPKGYEAPLRRIESTEWGGIDENVTDVMHPENVYLAVQVAKLFGLNVAGVDLITENISLSWKQTGAIVNEVNSSPLLGGAEISKSYIAEFLKDYTTGDFRIKVKAVATLQEAEDHRLKQRGQGLGCFIVGSDFSLDFEGQEIFSKNRNQLSRLRELVFRPDVDEILVVSNDSKALFQ